MTETVMMKTLTCPSCNRSLEEYVNEYGNTKNTYTLFVLDRISRTIDENASIIICNNCGFAGSINQFPS